MGTPAYFKKTFTQNTDPDAATWSEYSGYSHYADDVVKEFVKRSVDNGVSIIRIFDALNDTRNMECSMRAAKEAGAHVQGAFVYTISPTIRTKTF